ncbi:MAG: glycosyltransferase family 4 protein, partial [Candidatus Lambdaproteobacteria bacterium]|nr:glycosyltransferase family 4 protein [Candidatus Lambdaproteobacteria bacterium]
MTMLAMGGLTLVLTLAATRRLLQPGTWFYIVDHPGERSLHASPTPRTGGVAMLGALLVAWGVGMLADVPLLANPAALGGFVLIAGVSVLDDVRGLHQLTRLIVHVVAATLLVAGGYAVRALELPGTSVLSLGPLGPPLTVLAVVWLCNLYNFMDGMDGLAGGMGLIGFATLAWLGWRGGHGAFAMTALLLASANLGFLAFNFPPARIFMGDAGAVPMGFAAATLALWGVREGYFAWWAPLLIFSPFVVDATVTLIGRALRRERVWR